MKSEVEVRRLERRIIENPNDAEAHYELGIHYVDTDRLSNAIVELERTALLMPDNLQVHYELGLVYSRTGQYEYAIRQWRKIIDEDGDISFNHLDSKTSKFLPQALAMWKSFRDRPEETAYNFFTLGFAFMIMGKWEQAIEDFKEASTMNPGLENVNFYKGLCHYKLLEYKLAANEFFTELSSRPRHAHCLFHVGKTYRDLGNSNQAVQYYYRAIKEQPRYLKAHFELAIEFFKQGNYAKSVELMNKVLELNPNNVQAYFELGRAYEKQFLMDKAAACYEKALQIKPDYKEANLQLGLLYKTTGRPDLAMEYLTRTIKLNPREGDAYYYMGLIYFQKGSYPNAVDMFKKAIEIIPDHPYAHYSLGVSYFSSNQIDSAIGEYLKALALNPQDTQAQNALGLAYSLKGDSKNAKSCFQQALKINPADTYAHYNLAAVNFKDKDYNNAISSYKNAAELDPSHHYISFTKSVELIRNGNYSEAEDVLSNALAAIPPAQQDLSKFGCLQLLAVTALEQAQKAGEGESHHPSNEFESSFEAVLGLLADSIDLVVNGKRGHSHRVGEIASILAGRIECSPEEVRDMKIAGLLHDVGKILVPLDIHQINPKKRTEDDIQMIRKHPQFGYEMLMDIPMFEETAEYILYHHERYDGRGYPEALREDEIPLGAQILSIADYWDNLIHKKRLKPHDAVEHLISLKDSKFSSELLDVFLPIVDEIANLQHH